MLFLIFDGKKIIIILDKKNKKNGFDNKNMPIPTHAL